MDQSLIWYEVASCTGTTNHFQRALQVEAGVGSEIFRTTLAFTVVVLDGSCFAGVLLADVHFRARNNKYPTFVAVLWTDEAYYVRPSTLRDTRPVQGAALSSKDFT